MATIHTLVKELYEIVNQLDKLYEKKERSFTPDGHLVGSIGECIIADRFGLELKRSSNKGYDATQGEKNIEIKVTQKKRVAFRGDQPQFVIAGILSKKGEVEIIYNGPGSVIWREFDGKKIPSNGQRTVSVARLKELNETITDDKRIKE
jgi:hypothetical protein